jgi:hypothetical protein
MAAEMVDELLFIKRFRETKAETELKKSRGALMGGPPPRPPAPPSRLSRNTSPGRSPRSNPGTTTFAAAWSSCGRLPRSRKTYRH